MSRYTSADIEVHLTNQLTGMVTTDLDIDASLSNARQVVKEALAEAYRDYHVAVFMDSRTWGPDTVAACPEGIDEDEIMAIVTTALENYPSWCVETAPHTPEDTFIIALCREAGDTASDQECIDGFRGNHDPALITAAASGDVAALIELRQNVGLSIFR